MSLGGGQRIDNTTIQLGVILVVYTLLVGGLLSVFQGDTFVNQYSGVNFEWAYAEQFESTDYANMTKPSFLLANSVVFDSLEPDVKLEWNVLFGGDSQFSMYRKLTDWWNSWIYERQKPDVITLDEILSNVNHNDETSHFVFDNGDKYETHIFFYPLSYVNETTGLTYIYDTLEESFDNDAITVVAGTNATYPSYDVFSVFGVITGFDMYSGTPFEINVLVTTIFWVLVLLIIVKLFVG